MFSKLRRDLISFSLLICFIISHCYCSDCISSVHKTDLNDKKLEKSYSKNQKTSLIKRESNEKFDEKTSDKKKTKEIEKINFKNFDFKENTKHGVLKIDLRQIKTKSIDKFIEYIFNDKSIITLHLTTNTDYNDLKYVNKDKQKLFKIFKNDKCSQNLSISLPFFDMDCAEEMSRQSIVRSFSIKKNAHLKSENDFYKILSKNLRLSKLTLIGFSNINLLKVFSKHPSLESLNTSYTAITYDRAKSFLAIPTLKNLTIVMKDPTPEQEKKLMKKANSHKPNKIRLDLTKD